MDNTIYASGAAAIELPKLVRLAPNLIGAQFSLMKELPARFILDRAEQSGILRPGGVVVESSSGTFGLGLALNCERRRFRLIVVSHCIDGRLRRKFEALGATVDLIEGLKADDDAMHPRLDRVKRLLREHPGAFWPRQYDNPDNPRSYGLFASQLLGAIGRVGAVVGTVGSGGSVCGTTSYLRRVLGGSVRAVGVDTHASVTFGQKDGPRLLGGLGSSIRMGNVNHTTFDDVHWVTAAEAYRATLELYGRHGVFAGPTSGAAFLVARWYAQENPDLQVVCILPDDGARYIDTVYNEDHLRGLDLKLSSVADRPVPVRHPDEAGPVWSTIAWRRRPLEQVVSQLPRMSLT